jgi:hypothetical protein
MPRLTSLLTVFAVAACGDITRPGQGNRDDAAVPDAPPDVPEQPPPTPSRDLVGGAGRLSGATFTLEVEIGHPISQEPARGTTYTIQGNAAIKP